MGKVHTCNICHRKFRGEEVGRLQIVKRKKKGKVEFWICKDCAPLIKKKLKEIELEI